MCLTGLYNVMAFSVYLATFGKGHSAGFIFLSSAFQIEYKILKSVNRLLYTIVIDLFLCFG